MKRAFFRLPFSSLIKPLCCILFICAAPSCKKNNSNSKPSLTIKSINPTVVPVNGTLDIVLDYNAPNENLGGGYFVAIRNRLNQNPVPPGGGNTDTFSGPIPSFPPHVKGQLEFTNNWQSLHESGNSDPDTIIMKFAAIGTDSVSSDTIQTPKIIILSD